MVIDYGYKVRTFNKNKLNSGTYRIIRDRLPQLPSGLVQCARDQASEMLKRNRLTTLPKKKRLQIRYDNRTFKFYPESNYVSLSTVFGRFNFKFKKYGFMKRYLSGRYTNAQLVIKNGRIFLNIQCTIQSIATISGKSVLGIDRGILNIVTCDDNSFENSRHLREVKGRYRYQRSVLQSLGTRSARRKLRKLSGRERRFTLDTNHCISKRITTKPYDVFAVESLRIEKKGSRQFNRKLGGWSYGQLLRLLKYKAENLGKRVIEVNPRHTSQRCSRCGYVDKGNRRGLEFHCKNCGFQLNADLNAARNIGKLGKSELVRLPSVNQPIVSSATTGTNPTALAKDS